MSDSIGGSSMAEFTKFRSALNGFNRSDVTEYIEALCAKHQTALQDAQDEIDVLTRQLAQSQTELEARTAHEEVLKQDLEATRTALQSTETALDEAMAMLTMPAEAPDSEESSESEEETPDYVSLELEAYRRAEAMERMSADRAARMSQQLNDLLDQVSGRYEQTGSEIQVLTEDIRTNLKRLEEALSDLDVIFDETTDTFSSMDAGEPLVAAE